MSVKRRRKQMLFRERKKNMNTLNEHGAFLRTEATEIRQSHRCAETSVDESGGIDYVLNGISSEFGMRNSVILIFLFIYSFFLLFLLREKLRSYNSGEADPTKSSSKST